jgi:hypothetical protein
MTYSLSNPPPYPPPPTYQEACHASNSPQAPSYSDSETMKYFLNLLKKLDLNDPSKLEKIQKYLEKKPVTFSRLSPSNSINNEIKKGLKEVNSENAIDMIQLLTVTMQKAQGKTSTSKDITSSLESLKAMLLGDQAEEMSEGFKIEWENLTKSIPLFSDEKLLSDIASLKENELLLERLSLLHGDVELIKSLKKEIDSAKINLNKLKNSITKQALTDQEKHPSILNIVKKDYSEILSKEVTQRLVREITDTLKISGVSPILNNWFKNKQNLKEEAIKFLIEHYTSPSLLDTLNGTEKKDYPSLSSCIEILNLKEKYQGNKYKSSVIEMLYEAPSSLGGLSILIEMLSQEKEDKDSTLKLKKIAIEENNPLLFSAAICIGESSSIRDIAYKHYKSLEKSGLALFGNKEAIVTMMSLYKEDADIEKIKDAAANIYIKSISETVSEIFTYDPKLLGRQDLLSIIASKIES